MVERFGVSRMRDFLKGSSDKVHGKMSNILRSFGYNNGMLLQHKKLKVQKAGGTEDKLYKIDITLPNVCFSHGTAVSQELEVI